MLALDVDTGLAELQLLGQEDIVRALRLNALRLARQHESRYRTHVTAKNRGGREKENTNTTLSGLRVVRFICFVFFCFVLCFVFCASLITSKLASQ